MKANILETFHSIQGEGKYAGVSQVFLRFFECNMHCVWCDTPHSIGDTTRRYKEYSSEELLDETKRLWNNSHSVSVTGGEPLIQVDFLREFLPRLKDENMPVYLETNGVYPEALVQLIDDVDIIAMDIKLPSSTQCQPFWDEHQSFIEVGQAKDLFIKTVVTLDTSIKEVRRAAELTANVNASIPFYIQPNFFEMKEGVMDVCLTMQEEVQKYLKDVRVLGQTHKFMKLR